MNNLVIKFTNTLAFDNIAVYVDETPIKLKTNEFKNLQGTFQTEKNEVKIKICKILDIGGVWWFLTQLFFFVISIFGILDIHTKNRNMALLFESEVDLEDNCNISLVCNMPKDGAKAIEVKTDLTINELVNEYYIDEKASKKLKWLLISKIILAIAIIAIVIVVLILKI